MSDSLWPHGLQHTMLPSSSLFFRIFPVLQNLPCSNLCPLSLWCYLTISSSVILFSSCPQSFLHQGLSHWVSTLHQVAILECQLQHQSFQWISGFISFRMDLFDLLVVKGLSRIFSSPTISCYLKWYLDLVQNPLCSFQKMSLWEE